MEVDEWRKCLKGGEENIQFKFHSVYFMISDEWWLLYNNVVASSYRDCWENENDTENASFLLFRLDSFPFY